MTPIPACTFFRLDEHGRHPIDPAAGWVVNIRLDENSNASDKPGMPLFLVSFTAPFPHNWESELGQCVFIETTAATTSEGTLALHARDEIHLKISLRVFLRHKGLRLGDALHRLPHEAKSWWIVKR